MDDDRDHSPRRVFDPRTGADPDAAGVADGDDVPATGHRGSSDADEAPTSDNESRSVD